MMAGSQVGHTMLLSARVSFCVGRMLISYRIYLSEGGNWQPRVIDWTLEIDFLVPEMSPLAEVPTVYILGCPGRRYPLSSMLEMVTTNSSVIIRLAHDRNVTGSFAST